MIPSPVFGPHNDKAAATLVRVARIPNLRALAWDGDTLYASRGYELLRVRIQNPSDHVPWRTVASHRPSWPHRLSAANRLAARLFRDGFHALAVLPSAGIVAAVAGAILTLRPNQTEFRATHAITRGKRPLHLTAVPGGAVFWGEYFDNAARDEVHIYASSDSGATWSVAYTFPRHSIRHVHNIVHDPWAACLWVLTGDYGDECRILRASCDFGRVETVLQGNQQARSAALVPMADALYFSSDTPLEANFIYRLGRDGKLERLAGITSSSIYAGRVGESVFFSTMIEPSQVNPDRKVRIYGNHGRAWQQMLAWQKDRWPMELFQYGNAFLPDGNNTTPYLALSTIGVEGDDMALSLYQTPTAPLP
ncbi:MAG TPA: hypothetical protein VMG31_05930 [Verrucomicrobiae bacterium]|nr:hypothetical protein [Verrucomicrobiae bacterium]